ncbi:cathelicidin antimicrobial peptide [Xenopus laevis]|uniref:Cathelicidin antimicrobial peptide n=2 Tax=Xenopus laevis TaxID=8355 RepID=A0A1L8FV07_XENLA|nr:cathelicidin antimicrobial peptide [Xenopus laevis]OCT75383.1 hypothetical protein XELAEV_18030562mg [Xenopus laevis]
MYPANMETTWGPILLLCLCLSVHGVSLPRIPMTDMEVSAMALVSTEYYNRGSSDNSIFQLFNSDIDHFTNGSSAQIQFTIKETGCQKSDNHMGQECDFLEDGVMKRCTASFFPEDELPAFVITCDAIQNPPLRVRRNGGRGRGGGRGGGIRGGGKSGFGSPIAGVKRNLINLPNAKIKRHFSA